MDGQLRYLFYHTTSSDDDVEENHEVVQQIMNLENCSVHENKPMSIEHLYPFE